MSYPTLGRGGGTTRFSTGVTTVECHKQVRSWRLLRALAELLIPSCNCTFVHEGHNNPSRPQVRTKPKPHLRPPPTASKVLTGTIFGYRHGKVKLCIQTHTNSPTPLLLLELAVSTSILAREMRGGHLRIALQCTVDCAAGNPLLSTPVWTMYCNGKRVGLAIRRQPSNSEMEVLRKMGSVVSEAGVLPRKDLGSGGSDSADDIMYLRGNFHRVSGSPDSESFHLIDPDGNINQDLSIFFLRAR